MIHLWVPSSSFLTDSENCLSFLLPAFFLPISFSLPLSFLLPFFPIIWISSQPSDEKTMKCQPQLLLPEGLTDNPPTFHKKNWKNLLFCCLTLWYNSFPLHSPAGQIFNTNNEFFKTWTSKDDIRHPGSVFCFLRSIMKEGWWVRIKSFSSSVSAKGWLWGNLTTGFR